MIIGVCVTAHSLTCVYIVGHTCSLWFIGSFINGLAWLPVKNLYQ